jgi:hypothetical protein
MSASFGSATFEINLSNSKNRPEWKREPKTSVRPIPYAAVDDVQFGTPGPKWIECDIYVSSDASWNLLRGYEADGTPRNLTGFYAASGGSSFTNIYLMKLDGERSSFQEIWEGKAVFRQGS